MTSAPRKSWRSTVSTVYPTLLGAQTRRASVTSALQPTLLAAHPAARPRHPGETGLFHPRSARGLQEQAIHLHSFERWWKREREKVKERSTELIKQTCVPGVRCCRLKCETECGMDGVGGRRLERHRNFISPCASSSFTFNKHVADGAARPKSHARWDAVSGCLKTASVPTDTTTARSAAVVQSFMTIG